MSSMKGTHTNIVYKMANIPIKVYNLQKTVSSGLKEITPCCKVRTGRKTVCTKCENEVGKKFGTELLKGYPVSKTDHYIFSQEQINSLKDFDNIVEIIGTIEKSLIDPLTICGSYVVVPDNEKKINVFKKAFKVMQVSLIESEMAYIVKFSTRQKQKLGILTSYENSDVITLLELVYEENFNKLSEDEIPKIEISEDEKQQGLNFISKIEKIEVSSVIDDFKAKLSELIEKGEPLTIEIPENQEKTQELGFFTQ